jgi:glutamate 5-kinase
MRTREQVTRARRVVVKVGSSSLTSAAGGLDGARVDALVDVLAELRGRDVQVVLVSSGAIAAALAPLGLARRPKDLATLQAAASVGQGLLVQRYTTAFGRYDLQVGQILLTAEDVVRRAHYRNARTTLQRLLDLGVVPIVNENDTVANDEIRFGDNDRLAALVSHLAHADLLVLLSDVAGLYDRDPRTGPATFIDEVTDPRQLDGVGIGGTGSAGVGSGGMATKVEAARIAAAAGVPAIVCSAADASRALAGEQVGTLFHATGLRPRSRQLWLAHATLPRGRLILDDGAVRAVVSRRSSLLPAGITAVEGAFEAGDPVELVDPSGRAVARGLVAYDAAELPAMLGRSTSELASSLGPAYEREVVHRDDLVLLVHR